MTIVQVRNILQSMTIAHTHSYQGLGLNLQPLLCLSLLAKPPGMLDSPLDNSLNDPALNLVSLEL